MQQLLSKTSTGPDNPKTCSTHMSTGGCDRGLRWKSIYLFILCFFFDIFHCFSFFSCSHVYLGSTSCKKESKQMSLIMDCDILPVICFCFFFTCPFCTSSKIHLASSIFRKLQSKKNKLNNNNKDKKNTKKCAFTKHMKKNKLGIKTQICHIIVPIK